MLEKNNQARLEALSMVVLNCICVSFVFSSSDDVHVEELHREVEGLVDRHKCKQVHESWTMVNTEWKQKLFVVKAQAKQGEHYCEVNNRHHRIFKNVIMRNMAKLMIDYRQNLVLCMRFDQSVKQHNFSEWSKPVTNALEWLERLDPSMTLIWETGIPVFSDSAKIAVFSSPSSKSEKVKKSGKMTTGMSKFTSRIITTENPIRLGIRAGPAAWMIHSINGRKKAVSTHVIANALT